MSILLSCQGLVKSYPAKKVFQGLNFGIEEGQRIGLVGQNGAGKSTLLRILVGADEADEGQIASRKLLKLCYIEQEAPFEKDRRAQDVLMAYARQQNLDDDLAMVDVATALSQAGFENPDVKVGSLSGGWQKRLSLCRMMIGNPDLVLLDEPTNHLDWEGMQWLKSMLQQASFAWLMVSHDRYLLRTVVNVIADLNPIYPDGIRFYQGNYENFQQKRDEYIQSLIQQESSLSNKVRREEAWLRSGVKARGTKSRSRIQEANLLIQDLKQLRDRLNEKELTLEFSASGRKTKRLWVGTDLAHRYGEKELFRDCNLVLTSGMNLGILGPNGSGKSTLLKIIAGELQPNQGKIDHARDLKVVYFAQDRASIVEHKSVKDNLSETGTDMVKFQGELVHIISWAKRFRLNTEHLNIPASQLSGGEKARLALAKMMLQPADLLILDEPTNDLDLETLELLESALQEFKGSMILVSHDRVFLENLCDLYLGFDGCGQVQYFASAEQWEAQLQNQSPLSNRRNENSPRPSDPNQDGGRRDQKRTTKMSYKEKYELEQIEAKILEAENELEAAQGAVNDPTISRDTKALLEASHQLESAQQKVELLYARWAELDEKRQQLES